MYEVSLTLKFESFEFFDTFLVIFVLCSDLGVDSVGAESVIPD
jgi:hypothetical protein